MTRVQEIGHKGPKDGPRMTYSGQGACLYCVSMLYDMFVWLKYAPKDGQSSERISLCRSRRSVMRICQRFYEKVVRSTLFFVLNDYKLECYLSIF